VTIRLATANGEVAKDAEEQNDLDLGVLCGEKRFTRLHGRAQPLEPPIRSA
jgi:hypothetical protein